MPPGFAGLVKGLHQFCKNTAIEMYSDDNTVKLGDKERFDKEQIGVKEPFPETNLPIYFIRIRKIWRKGTTLG